MSHFIKTEEDFKELRELVWILMKSKCEEASPFVQWADDLVKEFGYGKSQYEFTRLGYMSKEQIVTGAGSNMTPAAKLTSAVHEPLLNHDWPEVLHQLQSVLQQMPNSIKHVMHIIWKVGTELITHEPDKRTRCQLMKEFYTKMKNEQSLDPKAVGVEYALFSLYNGDPETAKSVLQNLFLSIVQDKVEQYDQLCEGYLGLILYLEWAACERKVEEQIDFEDFNCTFSPMSQQVNHEMQTNQLALDALAYFKHVEGNAAFWDTFAQKHIELLVACDKQDEALKLMKVYSEKHHDHLNAQKFLYYIYRDHFPELKEDMICVLKKITELSRADPLVLDYCKLVGNTSEVIGVLFNLLDYPVWQNDVTAWTFMANSLQRVCIAREKGTEDAFIIVRKCWSIRETWWPSFHFTKFTVTQNSTDWKLLLQKCIIASILYKKDSAFVVLSRQKLRRMGHENEIEHVFKS